MSGREAHRGSQKGSPVKFLQHRRFALVHKTANSHPMPWALFAMPTIKTWRSHHQPQTENLHKALELADVLSSLLLSDGAAFLPPPVGWCCVPPSSSCCVVVHPSSPCGWRCWSPHILGVVLLSTSSSCGLLLRSPCIGGAFPFAQDSFIKLLKQLHSIQ